MASQNQSIKQFQKALPQGLVAAWSAHLFDLGGRKHWANARLPALATVEPQGKFRISGQRIPTHKRALAALIVREDGINLTDEKAQFEAALKMLGPSERAKFRDAVLKLFDIDNEHCIAPLIENIWDSRRLSFTHLGIPYTYNPKRSASGRFSSNISELARFLKGSTEAPSLQRLQKCHQIALNGVDRFPSRRLGQIREEYREGAQDQIGITLRQHRTIDRNPYLRFEVGPRPRNNKPGLVYGAIIYPDIDNIKDFALIRIKKSHPEVWSDVKAYQSQTDEERQRVTKKGIKALNQRLICALAEERYLYFNQELQKLAPLDSLHKVMAFIHLVADHYRDLISIHPFDDGNGTTCRHESLFDPFERAGLPRPRLGNPNNDILETRTDWRREVMRGVISSYLLFRDLRKRLLLGQPDPAYGVSVGMPLKLSPLLAFPQLPLDVGVHRRYERRKRVDLNLDLLPTAAEQYLAFAVASIELSKRMQDWLHTDPERLKEELREKFKQHIKRSSSWYRRLDGSDEFIQLELVDLDTYYGWGENVAYDAARWWNKVQSRALPELIFRGLDDRGEEVSLHEIMKNFVTFTTYNICENLRAEAESGRSHSELADLVRLELDRYQYDLIKGKFSRLALDHVNARGRYWHSYGMSSSKLVSFAISVATNFGSDNGWVLGALRARKDADTTRLHPLFSDFRSRSGYQQEVLVIGGFEPDLVVAAYRLDQNKQVEHSLIRNFEIPNEVWLLRGYFDPMQNTLSEVEQGRIQEVFTLPQNLSLKYL